MIRLSPALLAATAMTSGAALLTAAPVAAQKQQQQASAGPKLKLSKEVIPSAQAAQTALVAKDLAAAQAPLAAAAAAAKTDDDRYLVATLQLNYEVQRLSQPGGNQQNLRGPLDALLANPKTPREDLGKYAYQRGVLAQQARNQAEATTYFDRARGYGYANADLDLQQVRSKVEGGDVAGGLADLDKLIASQQAAGKPSDESFYRYGVAKAAGTKNSALTLTWIEKLLAAYPTAKNWRDMVVFYGIQPQAVVTFDKGQKTDLYRLLRSGRALADQYDYEQYGQWANDAGLPYETKTVIAEGKAAGKVPASSASANGLVADANRAIALDGPLSALEPKAKSGANGRLAANTADAYLAQGNNAKAIELYKVALQKGGVDAGQVNTRMGIAMNNAGDKAGARAAFQAVTAAPRADIARLWIAFIDHPPVG